VRPTYRVTALQESVRRGVGWRKERVQASCGPNRDFIAALAGLRSQHKRGSLAPERCHLMQSVRRAAVVGAACLAIPAAVSVADLPSSLDLRNFNGQNYVTSVKTQQGGTCWTHGAMAAIEGNLLMTGNWAAAGETGEPNLAEYHLDWWNGFNQHNNDDTDPPTGGGLEVHYGGDYRVTVAYLARGEGAVREVDGQSYDYPPLRNAPTFHHYYPRDIEWYTAGSNLSRIGLIKQKIMQHGVIGTAMCYDDAFMWNNIHYQPPSNPAEPNHAVAIIGWDDNKVTQAPQPGAWLCKNSWGAGWGLGGFFWISYYDKWCGQHPEMGAVSFQNVQLLPYEHIYYHDYHGWRDTMTGCNAVFNAFVAEHDELLQAVSFFTAADTVSYLVAVYDRFEGGQLLDELTSVSGVIAYTGFHTVDLPAPLRIGPGDDFFIYLWLSAGGQPYDRSSEIPVLLGSSGRVWVESASAPGQSYYYQNGAWHDLYAFNNTANFCVKGLCIEYVALAISFPEGRPEFLAPGVLQTVTVRIEDRMEHLQSGSGLLHYRYDGGPYLTTPLVPLGGNLYRATFPVADCDAEPEYYFSAQGDQGTTVLSPAGAPNTTYVARVGTLTPVWSDDFQTDRGWTVQNVSLTAGAWERGVPAGGGDRGDPPTDYDGSGACYLTGNAPGDTDVDGGPTRLISPRIELSPDVYYQVAYARWFYNDDLDEDRLTVEISNNDGMSWVVVESAEHTGGWVHRTFNVNDFVTPSSQVRLRFSAIDNPNNSITEAAVDAVQISALVCIPPEAVGDLNCDGQVGFPDINAFVLAMTNLSAYEAAYPGCPLENRDINGDGTLNFADINPFVILMTGTGGSPAGSGAD